MTKAHTAANDSLGGWVHVYEALHGSNGLLFCVLLTGRSRFNAVSNPGRQNLRPLADRLRSDAYGVGGSGRGASEQFNSFGFQHEDD